MPRHWGCLILDPRYKPPTVSPCAMSTPRAPISLSSTTCLRLTEAGGGIARKRSGQVMSDPLDFLDIMRGRLRRAGIRFALTSGMACVHYGLQQNTKDSDWIVAPDDLEKFRALLSSFETDPSQGRVSYRSIFGAPLEMEFLAHGWTSHVSVWDTPDSPEHRVDLFGKPPRVQRVETEPDDEDWASRHVVAQMKKTDRDRDWPIVDGLGWQLVSLGRPECLLHLQDPAKLVAAWQSTDASSREAAAVRRPLLRRLATETDPDRLLGFIRLERLIWESVNQERYGLFERAWKDFYRRWKTEAGWQWPTVEAFSAQHARLKEAARRHGLPDDPLRTSSRDEIVDRGLRRAATRGIQPLELILALTPPPSELMP